jgi:rhodanese-related sulfurtransferase
VSPRAKAGAAAAKSGAAAPGPTVTVEWLADHVDDPDLRIVHLAPDRRVYNKGHLPGATLTDLDRDLAPPDVPTTERVELGAVDVPTRDQLQATLRRWRVGDGDRIVLYEVGSGQQSSRMLALLDLYGFPVERVHRLDGGIEAWKAAGHPTTADIPEAALADALRLPVRLDDLDPMRRPAYRDAVAASTADEAPGLDRGQLTLVFGSQRGTSAYPHLYAATRPDASAAWQNATELTALSSSWQDTDPALFADSRAILFASRRLTQGRASDLFQASRPDTSTPFASSLAPITELNTDFTEEDPWIAEDGRHILFTSNRSGRNRIYEAWR